MSVHVLFAEIRYLENYNHQIPVQNCQFNDKYIVLFSKIPDGKKLGHFQSADPEYRDH